MKRTIPWSWIPKEPSKWNCKPAKNPPILVQQKSTENLYKPSICRMRTTDTLQLCLGELLHRKTEVYTCRSNTTSYEEQDLSPEVQNPTVYYSRMQVSPGQHHDTTQKFTVVKVVLPPIPKSGWVFLKDMKLNCRQLEHYHFWLKDI